MRGLIAATVLALSGVIGADSAGAVTITFDVLPDGTPTFGQESITNQYAPWGVTFASETGGVLKNAALAFHYSDIPGFEALSNSTDGSGDRETFLNVFFTNPASGISFDIYNGGGLLETIRTFGAGGAPLSTISDTHASDHAYELITLADTGVLELQIQQPQSGWIFEIKNLSFTEEVPEPATLAIMGAGLAAMSMARRRKR